MTIQKNDFIGHLKTPIAQLLAVSVLLPRKLRMEIRLESGHAVTEMLRLHPSLRGVPQCASIDNGRMVSVFPRADKRYQLRVLGTQYIEQ